jgi:hypothetical protein
MQKLSLQPVPRLGSSLVSHKYRPEANTVLDSVLCKYINLRTVITKESSSQGFERRQLLTLSHNIEMRCRRCEEQTI